MKQNLKSNHKKYKNKSQKDLYRQMKNINKKHVESEPEDIDYKSETYLSSLSKSLNLPPDLLEGAPILTACGKNQICLENYRGIIEYTAQFIKVQTKICKICISGKCLNIDYFTNDEMRISGIIHGIEFK